METPQGIPIWNVFYAAYNIAGTFGKLVQDINSNVLAVINERLVTSENSPSLVAEDETFRFAVTVIDNDRGPIALANITAGTYDLHRIRAGVETTIAAGVAFSKLVGLIYTDIAFATADWNPDDAYLVLPNFDTTVTIGGNTYYVPMTGWSGLVHNLTNIEGKIDTLQAALGNAGADMSAVSELDDGAVAAYIKYAREQIRGHNQTRIGLIVPSLADIGTDAANEAIFALLERISTPNYIDQTKVDAGQQNWLEYDLLIVGSDANYAFATANLDDLVTMKIPIIVVSSAVAIHLGMGHDAVADTGAVTNIYVETRGERVIGLLIDEGYFTGVGDQTIFSAGSVSSRLDMSDPQLSENLLATVGGGGGGTNAETVVGDLPYSDGSGAINTLDDNTEMPAGRTFTGCFLHAENLNSAGEELFRRLCLNITQSISTPSLEIKANAAKINRIWGETYAAGLAQGAGDVASNSQLDELVRAIADILRAGGSGDAAAIVAKTDLMNSDSGGPTTLNDANPSDTIVPSSLPTKMHLTFDISTITTNLDDITLEVKVGTNGNERVVAFYRLTSDGADLSCDKGSGVSAVIKERKIDISNILVFTSEQVLVERTKNAGVDNAIPYQWICGV